MESIGNFEAASEYDMLSREGCRTQSRSDSQGEESLSAHVLRIARSEVLKYSVEETYGGGRTYTIYFLPRHKQ